MNLFKSILSNSTFVDDVESIDDEERDVEDINDEDILI